jgi:hypothetical protein
MNTMKQFSGDKNSSYGIERQYPKSLSENDALRILNLNISEYEVQQVYSIKFQKTTCIGLSESLKA